MRQAGRQGARDMDGVLRDELGRFAKREGTESGSAWADAFRASIAHRLTGGALAGLMAPLSGVTMGLGLAAVGAQAAAAAAGVVQLAAALGDAAGAALVLPAALATVAAVAGTVRVAFSGMGDAFSAALEGDTEAFTEALEELSPAAQNVAREFQALTPEINDLKSEVQDRFFSQLQGDLTDMGQALSGPVSYGMKAVAQEAGELASGLAEVLAEAETADVVGQVFATAAASIDLMQPGIEAVAQGLRDLIGAALPGVGQLATSVGSVAERFGAWLSEISESGQALAWIQQAFEVLRQLGSLLGNLGGIVSEVFGVASEYGMGLLGTLITLTGQARDFLATAEGQTTLSTLFDSLREVSSALVPVLGALGAALAEIGPHAAAIAVALGPGLAEVVTLLGDAIAALGPGLTDVASALSDGLAAAGPGVTALAAAFGRVLSAVSPLVGVVGELVNAFGGVLASAIDTLMPVVDSLVSAFTEHLVPRLPGIADGFKRIVAAVEPLIEPLGDVLGAAIAIGSSGLDFVVNSLAVAIEALGVVLYPVIWLVQQFADLIEWLGSLFGELDWTAIFSAIGEALVAAWDWAVQATGDAIDSIVTWVSELPGRILLWLAGLAGQLAQWASSAWNSAWEGMRGVVASLLAWVGGIPGQVLSWLGDLGSQLWEWASSAWDSAWDGMKSGVSSILDWVGALPGRIVSALGDLSGLLFDAGAAILQGFLDGLKSIWDDVTSFVGGIVDWIADNKGPIELDRVLLVPHGRAIMSGLDEGLRAGIPAVQRTLHGLTRQIPRIPVQMRAEPVRVDALAGGAGALGAALAARAAGAGSHRREVHVHAPITVHTRASNPQIVAERTADRLALLAQA